MKSPGDVLALDDGCDVCQPRLEISVLATGLYHQIVQRPPLRHASVRVPVVRVVLGAHEHELSRFRRSENPRAAILPKRHAARDRIGNVRRRPKLDVTVVRRRCGDAALA